MKKECAKCRSMCDLGISRIEMGNVYSFCRVCADILEKYPDLSVFQYLGAVKKEDYHNEIQRNMRVARENRANGCSPWHNMAEQ